LFKFEFFYPPKAEYRKNLKAELARVDPDWKAKLDESGPRLKSLTNKCQPLIGHAVFLPFVESYSIVLDMLARSEVGEVIDKKKCVEMALKEGRQAYLLRRITSEASIGKILFENGFKMAESQGLTGETTGEIIVKRKALLRKFRALSRRMEKSRIELLSLADRIFD
jgi:glycerol-3-phosphate O-acyltransferase